MSHTDPIADMLTRIRNGIIAEKQEVAVPLSKIKIEIVKIFKREGYVANFKVEKKGLPGMININLKYKSKKNNVIEGIQRISKPGRRVYAGSEEIPKVLGGLGVVLLSTSKGILTGKECEKNKVGGEVLLHVW